jgi:hypothetical protein
VNIILPYFTDKGKEILYEEIKDKDKQIQEFKGEMFQPIHPVRSEQSQKKVSDSGKTSSSIKR